jgi:Flp pilus assembly protein TadD
MRTETSQLQPTKRLRAVGPLAAALMLAACAAPSTRSPTQTETVDATGFTITEEVRLGSDVRAKYDEAVRLLDQERYPEGIALLEQVTVDAPNVTAPFINLGIAQSRAGRVEDAEASLKRALALSPRHPLAFNELGMLYRKTGRFAEARASYERALELHPDFHYARLNLAILCDIYLKDFECALENYQRYESAVPDDEDAAMWIADVRNRAGR